MQFCLKMKENYLSSLKARTDLIRKFSYKFVKHLEVAEELCEACKDANTTRQVLGIYQEKLLPLYEKMDFQSEELSIFLKELLTEWKKYKMDLIKEIGEKTYKEFERDSKNEEESRKLNLAWYEGKIFEIVEYIQDQKNAFVFDN